jgi:hypothetical protein
MTIQEKDACFIQADIRQTIPIKPAEIVVFSEVLEHFSEADGIKVLKNIANCLTKQGYLLLTTPLMCPEINMVEEKRKFGHFFYWKQNVLVEFLKKIGFEIEEIWRSRFIGERLNDKDLFNLLISEYGIVGKKIFDVLASRYHPIIVKTIFAHILPLSGAKHCEILAKKIR